jgi:hypothetical protein
MSLRIRLEHGGEESIYISTMGQDPTDLVRIDGTEGVSPKGSWDGVTIERLRRIGLRFNILHRGPGDDENYFGSIILEGR